MLRSEMSNEELRIGKRDEVLRSEMLDSEKRDEIKEMRRGMGVMGRIVRVSKGRNGYLHWRPPADLKF
jgi:hypothetical protein